MTIIFFGTSEFAVPSLVKLKKFYDIAAVVSRSDKPRGRNLETAASPVKEMALSLHIPVISIDDMPAPAALAILKRYKADLFVVIAYGKILPSEILKLPRLYSIGLHASLLPKYRGASPINWAILNGEKNTSVTVFKLAGKMDAGDIIMQKETDILEQDNADTLSEKLSNLGANLLINAIDAIDEGKAEFKKQVESEVTFTAKLKKEDGNIEWNKPALEIHNIVRGLYGWPGAFSRLNGRTIKILVTEPAPKAVLNTDIKPGQIIAIDTEGIIVACGKGAIRIKELQAEGGKRMSASAYVLGNKVGVGDLFTR